MIGTKPEFLEDALGRLGQGERPASATTRPRLRRTPHLAALRKAGTRHIYADTADVEELHGLLAIGRGELRSEVDGNTANQPLVEKVAARYLARGAPHAWAEELVKGLPTLDRPLLLSLLYAIVCARVGNDMRRAFCAGRGGGVGWEVSLQLHMDLCRRGEDARRIGRYLARAAPGAFVKVPFSPDVPDCLLVARDLESEGVRVNFTSTFSARQALAAALLADVTRTNVFMGRLNAGLRAERLGEHVDLATQRLLARARHEDGVRTQLIVASVRDWHSIVQTAGCDAFTAPCAVLGELLEQQEVSPDEIECRLDASYEDALGVPAEVEQKVGPGAITGLYQVDRSFVQFLRELRSGGDYDDLVDGQELYKRFDRAGFADFFHAPTQAEREELDAGKLPQLDGRLVGRIALDTHYSLLANADFARHQRAIDAMVEKSVQRGRA